MEIKRIEVAFENGTVAGAQMTVVDDIGRESVVGLNTGNQPEYEATLNSVLGEPLSVALSTIAELETRIQELEALQVQAKAQLEEAGIIENE